MESAAARQLGASSRPVGDRLDEAEARIARLERDNEHLLRVLDVAAGAVSLAVEQIRRGRA